MSNSIEQAFIKQFESEVFTAYQRMGSKLRSTVRTKDGVIGASTFFQKVGRGVASTKARNANVPIMNLDRSTVEVVLRDYYAGDWVDKLDELKTNVDERAVVANAGAYALGRKTDELIIDQLKTTPGGQTVAVGTTGLTLAKVQTALEMLGNKDVPDDGQRFAVVGWSQWADLLALPEFSSADYVGAEGLPFATTQAKKWLGTLWIPHSGLPLVSTTRTCFWYHRSAIGHAIGQDIETDITWHGDKAANFINSMMSQGAKLIDSEGVVAINCVD